MELYHYQFSTMGCPATFQFYAESQEKANRMLTIIQAELNRLDSKYSNYSSHSYAAEINRTAGKKQGIIVDEETSVLLDYAQACYTLSDGLFDITAGILFKAWDFDSPKPELPSPEIINNLLQRVGWDKVRWNIPHLTLPWPGMVLDFGGIVKEYAADRVYALCLQQGINSGFIELGGDLSVIGPKPDGSSWAIGIQNPFDPSTHILSLELERGGIATSGDYARYIEIDGIRYSHIINPKTGIPIQSVGSVSVIADQCLVAGSATTIAFLMEERGVEWLQEQELPFAFISNDKKIICERIIPFADDFVKFGTSDR